jgi:heat shock protein HslJ
MKRCFRALAVLSLVVLASGCGGSSAEGGDDAAPGAANPEDVVGRSFISTAVSGTEIPGGGPLVLDFPEAGRIAATAGCNRMFGSVELTDGKLVAGQLASTLMACPPPRDGADKWVSDLLSGSPQWSLEGDTLTLASGSTTVTLTDKKVVDPDRPVTGTRWVLTELVTADAVSTSAALEAAAPTLTIGADGAVSGTTGCNSFTGTAQVGEGTISFGPLAVTEMACGGPELDEIQTQVLAVLSGQATVAVDGASMRITAADGTSGLGYTAAE